VSSAFKVVLAVVVVVVLVIAGIVLYTMEMQLVLHFQVTCDRLGCGRNFCKCVGKGLLLF